MKITTAIRLAKRKGWYFCIPGMFAYRYEDNLLACYQIHNDRIEFVCCFHLEQNVFAELEILSPNWTIRPSFEKHKRQLHKSDKRTKFAALAKQEKIDFEID